MPPTQAPPPSSSSKAPTREDTPPPPGRTSTGALISNTLFTLYELITAGLGPHPWPIHDLYFTPAIPGAHADEDDAAADDYVADGIPSNPQMIRLLASILRRRTDGVYDRKMYAFLKELNMLQMVVMPGPAVEDAFMHADGVLDRAKDLQRGMEGLLKRVREEKMRPAVRMKGVEGVEGHEEELVTFPFEMSDVRKEAQEGGEGEGYEDESDDEDGEKKGKGKGKNKGKKSKKDKKGKQAVKA